MRIRCSQPVQESRIAKGLEILVLPEHGAHSLARQQAHIWPPSMQIAVRGRVVELVQEKESNNLNLRISEPKVGIIFGTQGDHVISTCGHTEKLTAPILILISRKGPGTVLA
jgi:hypothetical protein